MGKQMEKQHCASLEWLKQRVGGGGRCTIAGVNRWLTGWTSCVSVLHLRLPTHHGFRLGPAQQELRTFPACCSQPSRKKSLPHITMTPYQLERPCLINPVPRPTHLSCTYIQAAESEGCQVVVMTHHAPSVHGTSHPMHDGSSIAAAFVTDLDQDPVLTCKAVRAWVSGHTHYCTRQVWGAGGGVGGGVEVWGKV